jgi:hypothetical protein
VATRKARKHGHLLLFVCLYRILSLSKSGSTYIFPNCTLGLVGFSKIKGIFKIILGA